MAGDTQLEDELPLTEATFCILLSLAPGPKHGYAIMKDVQQLSGQRVVLSTGTLYGALKRLLEQRWIAREDDISADAAGRHQKAYILTELGRRVLAAEAARLRSLIQVAVGRQVMEEG